MGCLFLLHFTTYIFFFKQPIETYRKLNFEGAAPPNFPLLGGGGGLSKFKKLHWNSSFILNLMVFYLILKFFLIKLVMFVEIQNKRKQFKQSKQ